MIDLCVLRLNHHIIKKSILKKLENLRKKLLEKIKKLIERLKKSEEKNEG